VLACLAAATPAAAQTGSAEDIAAARVLGTEGTRLADAGDCNGAIPKLASAEKLFHAPTTLDRLGECEVSVGKLVAGTEDLNRVVREQLAPNPPPAFLVAKKRAQQVLAAAVPRIGNLKIHVDGAPPDKLSIVVDGAAVSAALLDGDRPTDPGPHQVSVSAVGYRPASSDVNVREGGESSVSLKLEVDPTAVAVAPTPVTPGEATGTVSTGPAPRPAPESGGSGRILGYGALGLGGVGLVVGTVFGVVALGKKSTLDSACPNKVCLPRSQSDINSLGTDATISTIGFGVGIVGVAVGTILLIVSHKSETAAIDPPKPHISPWLGMGTAGVGGTFQ
jgi:hypothetical protein